MEWLEETGRLDPDQWESGLLRLDTSMPYLGATKPKLIGTLRRPKEGRALVWVGSEKNPLFERPFKEGPFVAAGEGPGWAGRPYHPADGGCEVGGRTQDL